MERIYEAVIQDHFAENRQMLFLVGPRQVGKTTTSLEVLLPATNHFYFNWDVQSDRTMFLEGPETIAASIGLGKLRKQKTRVVFDELHKYAKWKIFLKGFFDLYSTQTEIIVTGSARLDIYKAGGDSLMGRYFPYRLHPLSIAEIVNPALKKDSLLAPPKEISDADFSSLINYGGFPEPFVKRSSTFYTRWKRLRSEQLFHEDLRDLTKIQELGQLEILAELMRQQAGELTSYTSYAKKINVSIDTIKRWIETLKSFYYCFTVKPWTKNVTRSLLKEPKIYLTDWSYIQDEGKRAENFVAAHLLKAVHFWTDQGFGDFELYFLRDKDQREVDFLVSKNGEPWFLAEVKLSENKGISPSLSYYQEATGAEHAFQVVLNMDYVDEDCFSTKGPIIVPAKTFLSQLI